MGAILFDQTSVLLGWDAVNLIFGDLNDVGEGRRVGVDDGGGEGVIVRGRMGWQRGARSRSGRPLLH